MINQYIISILFLVFLSSSTLHAINKGAILYAKCISCHGVKGKKKLRINGTIRSGVIAGKSSATLVKKLKEYRSGSLNKYGMGGLMKGQVNTMSNEEIDLISKYISALH